MSDNIGGCNILLALGLNNWNESRKDKEYINNFYKSLKKELKATDKEITEKTPLQQKLIDSLDFYSNDETQSLLDVIDKSGGIKGPNIKLNYWNALSNSKIELIDYEKLFVLTDIEQGNELLRYKQNKLIDFVYMNMTVKGKNEKFILKIMLMELIYTQTEVQKDIRKILKE